MAETTDVETLTSDLSKVSSHDRSPTDVDNDITVHKEETESHDLVSMATEAIQAHSRLHHQLRKCKHDHDSYVFEKSVDTLDTLRDIKAALDGSAVDFQYPEICRDNFLELRQLTLMHVPKSITDTAREKFQNLIFKAFKGACKKLLSAVLVTCPWYEATQKERGEQARHNVLFIVYMSHDEQFLAPVNHHHLEKVFVTDEGWLYAVELYHFAQFMSKGHARCLEVLYCQKQAILYEDDTWMNFRESTSSIAKTFMGIRGFVEACRGQSAGKIGKKGKDGKFRLREASTFHEFSDSFRLCHHLYNLAQDLPPCTELSDVESLPDSGKEGVQLLCGLYQDPDVSKRDIFSVLMKWREEVMGQLCDLKFTGNQEVDRIVGKWQLDTRLHGRQIISPSIPDEHSNLMTLMQTIGGPVSKLLPEQILLAARAGSYMYNLSVPTSDVDYVVIYAEKTENLLGRCKNLKDNYENRGPTKDFEYGAHEARLFCEMVLKGSVVILELLYTDGHEYMSPLWKKLSEKRKDFVSERGIQQYLGLIRNNFSQLESEKHRGSGRERKLFYQIFHKMDSVRYMMRGETPPVKCSGQVRDFIMKIRTQPLEGDNDRDTLYKTATEDFEKLLIDLAAREVRLKENMDYRLVTDWLMSVRGIVDPV